LIDAAAILDGGHVALVFCQAADLGSRLIRLYDHGAWSHVDVLMPDGTRLGARDDVRAGVPAGVQIRPAGYAGFSRELAVPIAATHAQQAEFYDFLSAQLGKPYDETGLVSNFILGRDWREPDSWWCSELAGAALEPDGACIFPYRLGTPLNKLTPDGLFLACSAIANVNR
jgi:hypothetical protein